MARPIGADPNEEFYCIYCNKDVNANRDPGGYYLYCNSECEGLFENQVFKDPENSPHLIFRLEE